MSGDKFRGELEREGSANRRRDQAAPVAAIRSWLALIDCYPLEPASGFLVVASWWWWWWWQRFRAGPLNSVGLREAQQSARAAANERPVEIKGLRPPRACAASGQLRRTSIERRAQLCESTQIEPPMGSGRSLISIGDQLSFQSVHFGTANDDDDDERFASIALEFESSRATSF